MKNIPCRSRKWLCKPRLSNVIELNLRDAKLAESTIRLRRIAWRELADYAGHSDIETTLTHYIGTEKDLVKRARIKVNAFSEALRSAFDCEKKTVEFSFDQL